MDSRDSGARTTAGRVVRRRLVAALVSVAMLAMCVSLLAPAAIAQTDEVYETCALYNIATTTGASVAVQAAEQLQAQGAPNPAGVEDALQVLIAFESSAGSERPTVDEFDAAVGVLSGYFGPICDGLDICVLIIAATDTADPRAQRSADWADRLLAPSPPGIGAALQLLAGKIRIEDQLIHDSLDQARDAVNSYFASCRLAHTGSNALPVTLIGIGMAATGSAVLIVRRNLLDFDAGRRR